MSSFLHPILGLGGWEAYALVGALCFGEAALFVGFVLPGETAVVLGGVLASEHHVNLAGMCVLVVGCAILGDTVGYAVGRVFGPVLLEHRPLRGHRGVVRAQQFLQRRGAPAVFLGRFTAVFRAIVPGLAGVSQMRYRTFLLANAAGGIIWGLAYTFAGWAVGKSYQKILTYGGWVSSGILIAAAATVITFVVHRRVRERRAERRQEVGNSIDLVDKREEPVSSPIDRDDIGPGGAPG